MSANIYPTRRRRNFVKSQVPGGKDRAYAQQEGSKRISYFHDGGVCTQLAAECEMAGWIQPGPPVDGVASRRWWRTTTEGQKLTREKGDG